MARVGKQSVKFLSRPAIISTSTIVGPNEAKGPLRDYFHSTLKDDTFGEKTFEKAERKMLKHVIADSIERAGLTDKDIDMIVGGDLMNQLISASFTAREFDTIFLGLYGACSTMAESLAVGSLMVDSGSMDRVVCATGTHFSSVERQFRLPLEMGNQRPPSSQWTVTGAGSCIVSKFGNAPKVTGATFGKVIDFGVSDINNMGAAMAPAAMDTILAHFNDFNAKPCDYDLIITGDLGVLGGNILKDLMTEKEFPLGDNYFDCGTLIFDVNDTEYQGGSGCGCSAAVVNSFVYDKLCCGDYKKVLFVATGALLSPLSSQQGESIPSIAHAVVLEYK